MAAVTLGFAEIEDRLRRVRRRLNAITLQHTLYVSASVIALAAALLIVLALRGGASTFALGFWVALATTAVSLIVAALTLWRRWLALPQVARLADARARLDDRLATLIGQRARPRPSRLGGLLVTQALALAARWEARALAPRPVPRSLYLLIGSLIALAATTLIERRPTPPLPILHPQSRQDTATASIRSLTAGSVHIGRGTGARPDPLGRVLKDGNPIGPGDASQADGSSEDDSAAGPPGNAGRSGREVPGHHQRDERGGPAAPGDPVSERLQGLIRHAFGANPLRQPRRGTDVATRHDAAERDRQQARPSAGVDARPARRPEQLAAAETGRAGTARRRPGSGQEAERPKGEASGGSLQPSGHPGARGPGELFSDRASPPGALPDPKRFTLKLSALLHGVRTEVRSEVQKPPGDVAHAGRAEEPAREPQLSEQQAPEDPLRKAEIPPEHEAIVRGIFSRRPQP